jgi:hypothetical protein
VNQRVKLHTSRGLSTTDRHRISALDRRSCEFTYWNIANWNRVS